MQQLPIDILQIQCNSYQLIYYRFNAAATKWHTTDSMQQLPIDILQIQCSSYQLTYYRFNAAATKWHTADSMQQPPNDILQIQCSSYQMIYYKCNAEATNWHTTDSLQQSKLSYYRVYFQHHMSWFGNSLDYVNGLMYVWLKLKLFFVVFVLYLYVQWFEMRDWWNYSLSLFKLYFYHLHH